jgi:hypothetical protein
VGKSTAAEPVSNQGLLACFLDRVRGHAKLGPGTFHGHWARISGPPLDYRRNVPQIGSLRPPKITRTNMAFVYPRRMMALALIYVRQSVEG